MIWKVHHRWPAREMFVFNEYRHWVQLLLCQPSDTTVILLSWEGVTYGDPLSMVLYGITISPLADELRDADPNLLSPFYTDNVVFYGSTRQSAAQLRLFMNQETDHGHFPELTKSLFITNNPEDKEAERQ